MIPRELGLIAYHWDADGIASAAMVLRDHRAGGLAVPRIGLYTADAIPLDHLGEGDVLLLDYGLGQEELRRLAGRAGRRVLVVDHHLTDARSEDGIEVYNPSPGTAPSTTWVLRELLEDPPVLPLLVGLAGDQGAEIRGPDARLEAEKLLREKGWSYGDVAELADMLNSCAPLADYRCILEAPGRLLGYGDDLDKALRDEEWGRARDRVAEETEKLLGRVSPRERGDLLIYRVSSPYYLASRLGRRLASMNPDKTIMLVFERGDGYTEIYVRRNRGGLSRILKALKRSSLGLSVGGKDTVLAAQVPSHRARDAQWLILRVLTRYWVIRDD